MARNWDIYAREKDGKVVTKKTNGEIYWKLKTGKWEKQKKRKTYRRFNKVDFAKAVRVAVGLLMLYSKSKDFWKKVKRAEKISAI